MRPRTCSSARVPIGSPWLAVCAPSRADIPVVQQCMLRHGGIENGWMEDGLAAVGDKKIIVGIWYCAVFANGTLKRDGCLNELIDMGYAVEHGLTVERTVLE